MIDIIEIDLEYKVKSGLFGLAVGDALGVPVEFYSRAHLKENPVYEMIGFGTHYQPAGTWSDDSSLAFCLAESLCKGYDLSDIARNFVKWYSTELWTPHGKVFDIGIATRNAIHNIGKGHEPELCGGFEEKDNGNGSLMRILPLVFHLHKETDIEIIYKKVKEVLKAINLGEDTDTTAAITGGLAGMYYGMDSIPQKWITALSRKNDIDDLCERLSLKLK